MKDKKSSWDYQKNNYKQISIKFNMNDIDDATLYHLATNKTLNTQGLIKKLLREELWRCAYGEE